MIFPFVSPVRAVRNSNTRNRSDLFRLHNDGLALDAVPVPA
jgi:hypothetical protein